VHSSMPWYCFVAVSRAPVVHVTISFLIQGVESAAEGAEASVDGQACPLSTPVAHSASKNCPPVRQRAASSPLHGSEALPGVLSGTSRNCECAFACPPGHRPPTSAYMRMPHALRVIAIHQPYGGCTSLCLRDMRTDSCRHLFADSLLRSPESFAATNLLHQMTRAPSILHPNPKFQTSGKNTHETRTERQGPSTGSTLSSV